MSDTAPTTVLVVEDEVMIRMDVVETLQAAGFQTHEAGDSAEAIRILEKHPEIRVVFTDIQMPGDMDGLFALRARPMASHHHRCVFGERTSEP